MITFDLFRRSAYAANQQARYITLLIEKWYLNFVLSYQPSDVMFCLQSYQGLRIDRSLVY